MTENFNNELLLTVRQHKRFSQKDLAEKVNITQGHLSKLENGLSLPTEETLEALARILDYPVSFFTQSDRIYGLPVSVHPMYRKKADVKQTDLDGIQSELNIRLLHLKRLLRSTEFKGELQLPKIDFDEFGDAEEIARLTRRMWLIPSGPLHNLTEYIERAGCIVIYCNMSDTDIDGVTMRISDLPPCIFINQNRPADRMRFTLAHELGHLIMHQHPTADMEKQADVFASELLLPAKDLKSELYGQLTLPKLASLKPIWKCSMASILYKAQSIGAITANQARYLWQQMSISKIRIHEPPELDFKREEAQVFPTILKLHLDSLGYTVTELCKVFNIYEDEFASLYGIIIASEAKSTPSYLRVVK